MDAHVHLDFPAYDADREAVIARARAEGIGRFVLPGTDPDAWDRTTRLARQLGSWVVLGVHPWDTASVDEARIAAWVDDLAARNPDGIGEIGLDALRAPDDAARARQRRWFRAQLAVARAKDLPVVLHGVRAWPELLEICARDGLSKRGGMAHAWGGDPDLVDRAVAIGLHVSFGCSVIPERAKRARASVVRVPLERLLIETDGPDMRPPGVDRGEPRDLRAVAGVVAALRGVTVPWLLDRSARNVERLFVDDAGGQR